MVARLQECSEEFGRIWDRQEVGLRPREVKHFVHPEVGELELACLTLVDRDSTQALLVYTAVPGSRSDERLHLLAAVAAPPLR